MRNLDTAFLDHTQALLNCLRESPLLVGNLPEADCFDRSGLSRKEQIPHLNYSQKLGHLYEDALECLLGHSSSVQLLGKSIQVFDEDRKTLGELDYILRDIETGEYIHLELAVKFYLVTYRGDEPIYPGPDPCDNWLNKLKRLKQHQLKLVQLPETKKFLKEEYGITRIITQQLVYGKLFDHYLSKGRPRPPAMNTQCQRGTWKYLSEWEKDVRGSEIKIIPKCLWPVMCDDELRSTLPPVSREEFMMEASKRCTMIWNGSSNETQFIAPDNWL